MTGFDGLVEARSRQISDVVRRTQSRLVRGTGKSARETTAGENFMGVLGSIEETFAKAIGTVVSSDDKYSFAKGIGNYETQVGFADLFRDTGMPHEVAATLGIAAAIANPLDPINKLKFGQLTKVGKAAEAVATAGDNLVKGSDDVWRISTKAIDDKIASRLKSFEQGALTKDNARNSARSVEAELKAKQNIDELNELLVELQGRGIKVNELQLAGTTYDQVRLGQRHLIGFGSPTSFDHVPFVSAGAARSASIYGLSGKPAAALVKSVSTITGAATKPLKDYAYKVADYIGIPTTRSEKAKQAATTIKQALNRSGAKTEQIEREIQNSLVDFVKSYGPEGKEAAKNDMLSVLQHIEWDNVAHKQLAIAQLDKLPDIDYKAPIPRGSGAEVRAGQGLTEEQKIRLTQSGVDDADIPIAVSQFDTASTQSTHIGTHKQHELKVFGRYVVVKTVDPKAALATLDDLDGIYGNRVWAKHEKDGVVYLVQKRHPSAQRISRTDDFEPSHLRNLESIAAQLSSKKKGFTALNPEDVLVSPSGAVQIVNPSVITEFKSAKDALANSREALDYLADSLSVPRGPLREFPSLRNTKTARAVPRGVDGLTFRQLQGIGPTDDLTYASAHDILEQSVNVDGHRSIVRGSYDQFNSEQPLQGLYPELAERANNVEFHRKQIRDQVAQGLEPTIEPIGLTTDDLGNLWVANGRDRLTAALLEGFEVIPIYKKNFIGEVINAEKGFYTGKTLPLRALWNAAEDSSARGLVEATRGLVAANYTLIPRGGGIVNLTASEIAVDPTLSGILNRFITVGPQFKGKARDARLTAAQSFLVAQFGSVRNALIRISEIAEASPDMGTFAKQLESLLINPASKQGIKLDNVLRHPQSEDTFIQLRNAAVNTLDQLAKNGVLTTTTVKDTRRILLASDAADLVVRVLDEPANTLRLYSNEAVTGHLRTVADDYLNKTVTAADVEPYARIEMTGADGVIRAEVRDFVTSPHPKLQDVMEPVKVFNISVEYRDILKQEGVFVSDGANVSEVRKALAKKGMNFGVLLQERKMPVRSTTTGKHYAGSPTETVIVRPEFTYFVTRSGSLVVGTKHRNVNDLLNTVFEEGPRYFQEFGVITTGKVFLSNPLGSRLTRVGVGELRNLEDRLKHNAKMFKDLGLSEGTVMHVTVPFDDAVWRSMYGERVTIGDILKDDFRLKISPEIRGLEPDLRVLAPRRVGAEAEEGIVGLEKTRLKNEKMQELFDFLNQKKDQLFLEQAKAGLPIQYHSSWFGRNHTAQAKAALQDAWLKYPDKQSKTFKNLEPAFNKRVITDLTTQEMNTVIKRIQKEGAESVDDIITDVVRKYRDGYTLKPSTDQAASLVAIAKMLPEGIDFYELNPLWSLSLSAKQAAKAVSRAEIVQSLKDLKVAVWHGSPKQLDEIKMGKAKEALRLEKEVADTEKKLVQANKDLELLTQATPDLASSVRHQEAKQLVDKLTNDLAGANNKHADFMARQVGEGKVMDTMVDLESEQVWIRGEDITDLINRGVIDAADILGDPSDAFVRVPIKKYASILDQEQSEIFLFPKEVAGAVQRYFGATSKDGFGKFLQLWDTVQALWRNWTLFPVVAYHVRNFIGSLFQAYLGNVTDPAVYQRSHAIFNIIDGHRKGTLSIQQVNEALGAIDFPTTGGKIVTGKQVYDAFVGEGLLAGGLNYNEFNAFGSVVRASEFQRAAAKAGLAPSSDLAGSWLFDNTVLRGGVGAAAYVENRFRLATFVDALVKGHVEMKGGFALTGFEAAAMQTKRVFYDYTDLSAFERSWLRRALPFYAWSRKNIPRMLETMVTDPVKHYRMWEFFNEIETGANDGDPIDETALPDWIKNKFGLVVEKTKDGKYIVKTGDGFLPMLDAYKLFSGDGIGRMIQDGLTPFVKVPIEQFTNYSWYSQQSIEKVPGQRAQSFTLGQAGFSRRATTEGPLGVLNLIANESLFRTFFRPGGELATKVIDPIFDGKEGPEIKLGVYSLLLGRAYEIDPQQTRAAIYRDWTKRQGQLKSLYNQAVSQGDIKSAEDAARMLNYLRLGYPGDKEI